VRPVRLRSRIEALERRARENGPAVAVVTLYEDDDEAAAERWLKEFEVKAPNSTAVIIRLSLPRPLDTPPFWSSTL
jgi:hypothetical protein